jgi:hypothetical protein
MLTAAALAPKRGHERAIDTAAALMRDVAKQVDDTHRQHKRERRRCQAE